MESRDSQEPSDLALGEFDSFVHDLWAEDSEATYRMIPPTHQSSPIDSFRASYTARNEAEEIEHDIYSVALFIRGKEVFSIDHYAHSVGFEITFLDGDWRPADPEYVRELVASLIEMKKNHELVKLPPE